MAKFLKRALKQVQEDAGAGAIGAGSIATVPGVLGAMGPGFTSGPKAISRRLANSDNIQTWYDQGSRIIHPLGKKHSIKKKKKKSMHRKKHTIYERTIDGAAFDSNNVISRLKNVGRRVSRTNERPSETFGLQDEHGDIITVTVDAEQAREFDQALMNELRREQHIIDNQHGTPRDIAEILFDLRGDFNIIDIQWPGVGEEEEEEKAPQGEGNNDEERDNAAEEDDNKNDVGDNQADVTLPAEDGNETENLENLDADVAADDEEEEEETADASVDNVVSLLQQVIDTMKAQSDAQEASATALKAKYDAKKAEYAYQTAELAAKRQEEVLDAEDYYKNQDDKEKEFKEIAKLARYRHDLAKNESRHRVGKQVNEQIRRRKGKLNIKGISKLPLHKDRSNTHRLMTLPEYLRYVTQGDK